MLLSILKSAQKERHHALALPSHISDVLETFDLSLIQVFSSLVHQKSNNIPELED